jgi:hypothetical protein
MKTREVIRSVPAILLFLGSLQSAAQAGASRQQQIEAHNRQAQQYLKENRADLASAELRQSLPSIQTTSTRAATSA